MPPLGRTCFSLGFGTLEWRNHWLGKRRPVVATQPEMPPPDTIEPQSPPETPPIERPAEQPVPDVPEVVPEQPDHDRPDRSPPETPPPPD